MFQTGFKLSKVKISNLKVDISNEKESSVFSFDENRKHILERWVDCHS